MLPLNGPVLNHTPYSENYFFFFFSQSIKVTKFKCSLSLLLKNLILFQNAWMILQDSNTEF